MMRLIFSGIRLVLAWAGLALFFAAGSDYHHSYIDGMGNPQMLTTSLIWQNLLVSALIAGLALVLTLFLYRLRALRSARKTAGGDFNRATWIIFPYALHLLILLRFIDGIHDINRALVLLATTLQPLLFLLITTVLAVSLLERSLFRNQERAVERQESSHWREAAVVFILFFFLFLVLLPGFLERELFSGDQPHYLLVTHSILEDGDIAFADEYADGVYLNYDPIPSLEPQSLRDDRLGQPVPFHRIGLSLMAVPFYAAAGLSGAVFMIVLMASGSAALLYYLLRQLLFSRRLSALMTVWALLSVPLFNLGLSFMTEIPLVFFILLAAVLIIRSQEKYPRLILLLLVIWWLPWLHTRGFPIALFLAGLTLWQLRRHRPQAALFALGSVALALTTPAWNYVVYGDFSLLAQMTEHASRELALTNIFGNSLAVLFDSRYGIVIHNPLCLFVFPGLVFLWLRRRGLALVVLLYTAFAVGPGLLYHHWWGGLSPARYLAVTMPAAAILVAFAYRYSNRVLRKAILACLVFSLIAGWISVTDTQLITSLRSTPPALLASISFGVSDASVLWPSWFDSGLFTLHVLLLVVVAVLLYLTFRLVAFNPGRTMLAWCAVAALLPVWHELSALFQESEFAVRDAEEFDLYQRYRHERGLLLDYLNTFSVQGLPPLGYSAIRVFGREELQGDTNAPRGRYFPLELTENTILLTEGHPLWAGNWELKIGLAAAEPTRQKIVISDVSQRGSDTVAPVTDEIDITPEYRGYAFMIQLEENSRGLEIRFPGAEGLRYAYAMLSPWDVKTASQWTGPPEAFDMASLVHNEFVLYMQQSATHVPDSRWFWTRGNSRGTYWISAPRNYSGVQLRLRSSQGVSVRAESSESSATAAFSAGDLMSLLTLETEAKSMGDAWWTGFNLIIDGTFRPEAGEDQRNLGTHTRVSLKR